MIWKWFTKEEDPKEDELRAAIEENKAALQETIRSSVKSKSRASELVNLSKGALDILGRAERESK